MQGETRRGFEVGDMSVADGGFIIAVVAALLMDASECMQVTEMPWTKVPATTHVLYVLGGLQHLHLHQPRCVAGHGCVDE